MSHDGLTTTTTVARLKRDGFNELPAPDRHRTGKNYTNI